MKDRYIVQLPRNLWRKIECSTCGWGLSESAILAEDRNYYCRQVCADIKLGKLPDTGHGDSGKSPSRPREPRVPDTPSPSSLWPDRAGRE